MQSTGFWNIQHKDFLDLIAPSFTGVEDAEDMAAILARMHVIVLTENGVYYRVASTEKGNVDFIAWQNPQMKDILAPEYKPIFKAYKADPEAHVLPEGYHADLSGPKSCFANFFEGNQLPEPLLFVNVAFSTRMCARCKKLHVFFPQQNLHCK